MWSEKISQARLWAWIFAAMTAPAAYFAGRGGYPLLSLTAAICLFVCWGVTALDVRPGKGTAWLQFLWLALAAGEMAKWLANCWPTAHGGPLIPLTVLVLAAVAGSRGADRAARAGSILFWFLLGLYALVLFGGARDGKGENLVPDWTLPPLGVVAIYLLPAVAGFLPRQKAAAAPLALAGIGGLGILASVITLAVLSPQVAAQEAVPFYTFSKGLSLFGVAERFEALVSAGLTMGFFCLLSFLCAAAGQLAETLRGGWGTGGSFGLAALSAFWLLLEIDLPGEILAGGCLLFWVLVPTLTRGTKKLKKVAKNA